MVEGVAGDGVTLCAGVWGGGYTYNAVQSQHMYLLLVRFFLNHVHRPLRPASYCETLLATAVVLRRTWGNDMQYHCLPVYGWYGKKSPFDLTILDKSLNKFT